jgi:hypothetical protein
MSKFKIKNVMHYFYHLYTVCGLDYSVGLAILFSKVLFEISRNINFGIAAKAQVEQIFV